MPARKMGHGQRHLQRAAALWPGWLRSHCHCKTSRALARDVWATSPACPCQLFAHGLQARPSTQALHLQRAPTPRGSAPPPLSQVWERTALEAQAPPAACSEHPQGTARAGEPAARRCKATPVGQGLPPPPSCRRFRSAAAPTPFLGGSLPLQAAAAGWRWCICARTMAGAGMQPPELVLRPKRDDPLRGLFGDSEDAAAPALFSPPAPRCARAASRDHSTSPAAL